MPTAPRLNDQDMIGVFGHGCFDMIAQGDRCPGLGELEEVTYRYSLGGPIFNTGGALSRIGARTHIVGAVGDDLFTDSIHRKVEHIRHLAFVKSDYEDQTTYLLTRAPAVGNSVTVVVPHPDRGFLHQTGVNDVLDIDMLDTSMADKMSIAHFGYPALLKTMSANNGEQTVQLLSKLHADGATTSLDHVMYNQASWAASFDWQAYHEAVLPHVDVFCPSFDELIMMLFPGTAEGMARWKEAGHDGFADGISPEHLRSMCERLFGLGTKIILLKLGKHGLYLRTTNLMGEHTFGRAVTNPSAWSNREIYMPAFFHEKPLTTGAGDAAIAGFLSALNSDLPPDKTLLFAAANAYCCCCKPDAISGINSWDETWGRLDRALVETEPIWFDTEAQGFVSSQHGLYYGPLDQTLHS